MRLLVLLILCQTARAASPFVEAATNRVVSAGVGTMRVLPDYVATYGYQWETPDVGSLDAAAYRVLNTNQFNVYPCTITLYSFVQPASNATVNVHVHTNNQFSVGQRLYGRNQNQEGGWYEVVSKLTLTNMVLRNLGSNGYVAGGVTLTQPFTISTTNTIKSVDWDDVTVSSTDYRPYCADQSWNTLILNDLNQNSNTLRYILFNPGDYRPLGTAYRQNPLGTNRVYFLHYDTNAPNPFLSYPTNRVTLEAFDFAGVHNTLWSGLDFNGYYDEDGGLASGFRKNGSHVPSFNVVDRCRFVDMWQHAIQVRGGISNWIQRCEFTSQKYPCAAASPAVYLKALTDTGCDYLTVVSCTFADFVDGITVDTWDGTEDYKGNKFIGNRFEQRLSQLENDTYGPGENAIDFKASSMDSTQPNLVLGNHFIRYRPTRAECNPPNNSGGQAISTHFFASKGTHNINVLSNTFVDCNAAMFINSGVSNILFAWNTVRAIHDWGPIEGGSYTLSGSGVYLAGSTTPVTVVSNAFQNVTNVIRIDLASYINTNGMTFERNTWSGERFVAANTGTLDPNATNHWHALNTKTGGYSAP